MTIFRTMTAIGSLMRPLLRGELSTATPVGGTPTPTPPDETPDAFAFTDVSDADLATQYTSNAITLAGLGSGVSVAVSITGGTYSKNGGGYTSSAGSAQNGDTFAVRQTSSASNSAATNVTLTIGGVSDTYTVTTAAEEATAEIWLLGPSDSRGAGREAREETDWSVLPSNIWAWRDSTSTIDHALPLDQAESIPDYLPDPLSPMEKFAADRHAETGLPIYLIPYAMGGSTMYGPGSWEVGGTLQEGYISNANTAIQAILALEPGARVAGWLTLIGTNNALGGTGDEFYGALAAQQEDFRTRVFQNGVSGENVSSALGVFIGLQPETRRTGGPPPNNIERGICKMSGTAPNGVYVKLPDGLNNGDNLHEDHDGINMVGQLAAAAVNDTVPPVIDFPSSFSIFEGQKLARLVTADKDCYFAVSGADAALFEIAGVDPIDSGGPGSDQFTYRLRFVGDGDAPAAGTYSANIDAIRHGVTTSKPFTMTAVAEYGTQVEPIAVEWTIANGFTDTYAGQMVMHDVPFKRGLNVFSVLKVAGSGDNFTECWASNGLIGVRDANSTVDASNFYFYSAQDEVVSVYSTVSGPNACWGFNVNVVGTVATPSASETTTSTTTGSLTCPTDGVIVNAGFATSGTSPAGGCTDLPNPPIAGDAAMYANYRTTTGAIGAQGGFARLFASTWAKAA